MSNFAILMTCFNRKNKTNRCLDGLFSIVHDCDIYLVDDASPDGTGDFVKEKFNSVNVISGSGNLFWNRGMRAAWVAANNVKKYKNYIWINDDVVLNKDAFNEIIECSRLCGEKSIISGIISSHDGLEIIYGGFDCDKKIIKPNGKMQKMVHMNGNFVLIPEYVFDRLGFLDEKFWHDLGDVDYGLRAISKGINVFSTRCVVGSCDKNNSPPRVRANGVSVSERFLRLYSPFGSNPFINFYFRRRHHGLFNAIIYFIYLHILNLMPDSIVKLFFGYRYLPIDKK